MKKTLLLSWLVLVLFIANIEGKRSLSRSRGSSSRTSSRSSTKYSSQPAQAPAPAQKTSSLFGWQESKPAQKPAKKTNTNQPSNTKSQSHSYPSSNTGLSGSKQSQWQPVQKSNVPQNSKQPDTRSHSYPSSNSGLSGNGQAKQPPSYQESLQRSNSPHNTANNPVASVGSSGHGYPQQQGRGLSGSSGSGYPQNNPAGNTYQHPQPPPPYSQSGYSNPSHGGYGSPGGHGAPGGYGSPGGYGAPGAYGGYGGHGHYNPGYASQMPGYFGNYGSNKGFGGVSRTGNVLTGVGIAGAGIGTVLTGLALWNLARSTGNPRHTVIYDNHGAPVAVAPLNGTEAVVQDSFLANLVNCTLTIDNGKSAEVLAIPCAIATSFSPEADIKDVKNANPNDTTKCTITVVTKEEKEFMTTIPCSILLNTAAENNVTEPPVNLNDTQSFNATTTIAEPLNVNITNTPVPEKMHTELRQTTITNQSTLPSINCMSEAEITRNSSNPCIDVSEDLTVVPLPTTEKLP